MWLTGQQQLIGWALRATCLQCVLSGAPDLPHQLLHITDRSVAVFHFLGSVGLFAHFVALVFLQPCAACFLLLVSEEGVDSAKLS